MHKKLLATSFIFDKEVLGMVILMFTYISVPWDLPQGTNKYNIKNIYLNISIKEKVTKITAIHWQKISVDFQIVFFK